MMGDGLCKVLFDNDSRKLLPRDERTRIYIQDQKTGKRSYCPRPGIQGKEGWCEVMPKASYFSPTTKYCHNFTKNIDRRVLCILKTSSDGFCVTELLKYSVGHVSVAAAK